MKLIIKGRLDSLNEYTRACRTNVYVGNNMKRKNERMVTEAIRRANLKKILNYPVSLDITWYEPNSRRDIDNITFATKFIQDALVKSGIINDDSQQYIDSISHSVRVDKSNPRIEVVIGGQNVRHNT